MTFENWILTKVHDQSAVGDLARDYRFACRKEEMEGKRRDRLTEAHLYKNNACIDVFDALRKARKLYEEEYKS